MKKKINEKIGFFKNCRGPGLYAHKNFSKRRPQREFIANKTVRRLTYNIIYMMMKLEGLTDHIVQG